jgi:hypothetical protein
MKAEGRNPGSTVPEYAALLPGYKVECLAILEKTRYPLAK